MNSDQQDQDPKGTPAPPAEPQTKAERDAAEEKETQRLLAMKPEEVLRMYGVRDEPRVVDEWGERGHESDDPGSRAAFEQLQRDLGGAEGMARAREVLIGIEAMFDPGGERRALLAAMTPQEESAAIKEMLAEWDAALKNPQKARALIADIYDTSDGLHPILDPNSNVPAEAQRALEKLFIAAYPEKEGR